MIGSTVNPALGRIDYSPITQGAQSAAQSIQNAGQITGQMYANLGKQISGGFEQYQKNKEERDFYETAVRSKMGEAIQSMNQFKANPKLYGDKAPIRPEMLESISVEDIPKISIGKLKSYANELDGILQKSRGALAEANAIRQAERDISMAAQNKELGRIVASQQGLQVPTGNVFQEKVYRSPTVEEGRSNLANILSSANYGKSLENKSIIPGATFSLPDSKPISKNIEQFVNVNNYTGQAKLNQETVDRFNQQYDSQMNKVKSYEEFLKTETAPVYKLTGTYGPQLVGSKPLTETDRTATNNLYADAKSQLATLAQTKKSIDEAKQFVEKNAQGATPAEIKTFISKDKNLTPIQSVSFDVVTTPEYRNATAQEKTDKVFDEYFKQGGELGLDFLAKVQDAFKVGVNKVDLGGGFTALTYGNNFQVIDTNKNNKPISLAERKDIKQDQYQELLNYAVKTYGSWNNVPDKYREYLASLTAAFGGRDITGMPVSVVDIFNKRLEVLRGTPAPAAQNGMLSPPSGFTPTQTRR